jgi:ADP-ribosylglycohydrolase
MRVAPVGLVCGADSFDLGCRFAALTHGHPSGWMAAGALAAIVEAVTRGVDLGVAAQTAAERCREIAGGYEVAEALEAAVALSQACRRPSADDIESLGAGWVAEEALAISVYCALTATDFRDGVLNAVNHSGDSDSTGSITGNLLGTSLGVGDIDDGLLEPLEGREVIEQIADDLYDAFVGGREPDSERYPPW